METINSARSIRAPWSKGKLVGQKAPFKPKEIWAIRRFLVPEPNSGVTTPVCPPIRRIVDSWVQLLGLDTTSYGTHTLRRTKATLIYRRTKNLRAVQLLLGHSKLESTVRYLGIEVDEALEMAEQTDV